MPVKKEVEPEQEQTNAVINHETAESRTIASPLKIRDKGQEDTVRFRSKGGAIGQIDSDVTGGSPRKLQSSYGAHTISF